MYNLLLVLSFKQDSNNFILFLFLNHMPFSTKTSLKIFFFLDLSILLLCHVKSQLMHHDY